MSTVTATVVVYTKPACVQCNATYKSLDTYKVPYTVVDISLDQAARDFVFRMGYLQAPVVHATFHAPPHSGASAPEPLHWSAFRPERIKKVAEMIGVDVRAIDSARYRALAL